MEIAATQVLYIYIYTFFISVNGNLLQAVTDFLVGVLSIYPQAQNTRPPSPPPYQLP
jgi:hypothetical protein